MPVAGSQGERILRATVQIVAERGMTGASVGLVTARAKVSSRTFYEQFTGLDDCLVAVMGGALQRVGGLVSRALEEADESWPDGVCSALAAVLAFFDSEPDLARVCFVETLSGVPKVVEQREQNVRALRALILTRIEDEGPPPSPLAAEGVMASVMGVIRTRLIAGEPQPLITLLGPLMGMIATPFLTNEQATIEEEVLRGDKLARAIQTGASTSWAPPLLPTPTDAEPSPAALPAILSNPTARRARECVRFLANHPDTSNREIAMRIGVTQKSQISTLLSRLLKEELVVKRSEGPGRRNAWRLTPHGEETVRALPMSEE